MKKIFIAILGLFIPFLTYAHMGMNDSGTDHYGMMGLSLTWFMIVTWLVWLTVGILAIVWFLRQLRK